MHFAEEKNHFFLTNPPPLPLERDHESPFLKFRGGVFAGNSTVLCFGKFENDLKYFLPQSVNFFF